MDENAAAAIERVNQRAADLAKDICDSTSSIEAAHQLLIQAHRMLDQRFLYGINAPAFQQRLADRKQKELARVVAQNDADLRESLTKLGIDPEPIFADRAAGGD